jgi:hypothetical protein
MSQREIVIEGTLKPDGTLELDHKPSLPPGRVTVLLRHRAPPPPSQDSWLYHLQRIRADREASGYPFMTEEEMRAHVLWLREGAIMVEVLP